MGLSRSSARAIEPRRLSPRSVGYFRSMEYLFNPRTPARSLKKKKKISGLAKLGSSAIARIHLDSLPLDSTIPYEQKKTKINLFSTLKFNF